MDFKSILKLVTHPLVLASVGGWYVRRTYGKKLGSGYLAAGLGGAAGYAVGKFAQENLFKDAPALPAATATGQQYVDVPPATVELDFTPSPRVPTAALPEARPEAAGVGDDAVDDGYGIFDESTYDVSEVEQAMQEGIQRLKRSRN